MGPRESMKRRVADNHDVPRAHGFGKGKKARPGRYVMFDGKLTHVDDVAGVTDRLRQRDATNIESVSMGVALSQMGQMNKLMADKGVEGVKFVPNPKHGESAICVCRDRQAKLAAMRARGMYDFEEVRG